MPDNSPFYGEQKEDFDSLQILYREYIESGSDQLTVMEKIINVGFPILGWGAPPEMFGGYVFFHTKSEFLPDGKTSAKLGLIFQKVLTALIDQGIIKVKYGKDD